MFDFGKPIAVLGIARSGIAAARKIRDMGGTAFLSDSQPADKFPNSKELLAEFACEFGGHTEKLMEFDTWIVSPGIPLDSPIIRTGLDKGKKLISEIEFGYRIKAPDSRIIAVTGSNGKSTTVSIIHHILKNMGYNSILAGNIGSAMCSHPIEKPGIDFLVLEVSSFQLDLIDQFKPDVAVLLNITPDHLNRYESFDHYADSKFRIFMNQKVSDTAVISLDSEPIVARQKAIRSTLKRFSLIQTPPQTDAWLNKNAIQIGLRHKLGIGDLKIMGAHNHANAMAALLSVDAMTRDLDLAIEVIKEFQPLEHRLEYVETINGVLFYNDSKATNTDSVKCALTSFEKPIRVIMGGSDKGEDFGVLVPLLKKWAKKAYITGGTLNLMKKAWEGRIEMECIPDFEDAVRAAYQESQPGDVIVLSPACASFDRFRNYEHRGEVFKELVRRMAAEHEKK